MRWERQRVTATSEAALPIDVPRSESKRAGTGRAGLAVPTPEPIPSGTDDALAIEIHAKSLINRVPGESHVPFRWTINPYRGCSHSCVYCFARRTHEYLEFDSGHDFDSKIVVKVNAGELVRHELASPKWSGEPIAMGTNTDPYQRAEGRFGLMREILSALRDFANPFSILTKGTLILRDLDVISEAAERADVSVAVSVGSLDDELWRKVEPGTPAPRRRLEVVRRFDRAGVGCSVLMAPILPGLSDSPNQVEETVGEIAEAGASSVTPLMLHLRPGAREWYRAWLQREYPHLVPLYSRLYGEGSYLPKSYQDEVLALVSDAKRRHGMERRERRDVSAGPRDRRESHRHDDVAVTSRAERSRQQQLSLL